MDEKEKPTHEQALRDAINTDAGVVSTATLVAYLESRREAARDQCMRHACDPRDADRVRGAHSLAGDLIKILTNPTREPETP
jgi:hypothetical protein